jgi:hypothetical protein
MKNLTARLFFAFLFLLPMSCFADGVGPVEMAFPFLVGGVAIVGIVLFIRVITKKKK